MLLFFIKVATHHNGLNSIINYSPIHSGFMPVYLSASILSGPQVSRPLLVMFMLLHACSEFLI